ncbi:MAG: amidase, partial [Pseudomonadota bacterium]
QGKGSTARNLLLFQRLVTLALYGGMLLFITTLRADTEDPLVMHNDDNSSSTVLGSGARSIEDLQQSLVAGDLTSVALVDFFSARINQFDQAGPTLNSIAHLNPQARSEARVLDRERATTGPRSLLHGIPVVVKDNYETEGMPTTAGSQLFADYAPQRDAFLVQQLKSAGALILAKTTMHEFAYGITTVGSGFGATRNPYDLNRNPGGSSGGTGAAVAANLAVVGMGSDTCGSIRIPAAQNNLFGLRGTQGLSSRRGIVPLSSTQDIGGPLARSVRDLAIVLDVTATPDALDPQTVRETRPSAPQYLQRLQLLRSARIGVLQDWFVQEPADEAVAAVVQDALRQLAEQAGWQVQSVASPELNQALDRAYGGHVVLITDFAHDINRYLQANPELGYADLDAMIAANLAHKQVQASLRASANLARADQRAYQREFAQRQVVRDAVLTLMQEYELEALVYPTIRQVAAPLGQEQPGTNCRISANSGLPAISVPAGFTAGGMPVGLELLAGPWQEQLLLNLAYTVEQLYPQRRRPAATP